jgi:hypothetical protein
MPYFIYQGRSWMIYPAFEKDSEEAAVHVMRFFVIVEYIPIHIVSAVDIVTECLLLNSSGKRECAGIVNFGIIVIGIVVSSVKYLTVGRKLLNVNNYKNFYGRMKPIQDDCQNDRRVTV